MNFENWLKANGISWKLNFPYIDEIYEHLENVIGNQYWICDYRLNREKNSRPIRNITPKLVQVFSNADLPKNKRVYYSPIHFREVKNGKVSATVIGPYDNTGYRSYRGVSVNIFDTKTECIEFFTEQCNTAIREYEEELTRRTQEIHYRIDEIKKIKEKFIL